MGQECDYLLDLTSKRSERCVRALRMYKILGYYTAVIHIDGYEAFRIRYNTIVSYIGKRWSGIHYRSLRS